MNALERTVAAKSRRAMTKAERRKRDHCAFSSPIAAAALAPAIATKAS